VLLDSVAPCQHAGQAAATPRPHFGASKSEELVSKCRSANIKYKWALICSVHRGHCRLCLFRPYALISGRYVQSCWLLEPQAWGAYS